MADAALEFKPLPPAQLVKALDPKLAYVKDLSLPGQDWWTLLTRRGQSPYVLKARRITTNIWDDTYFQGEIHALRRAEECRLEAVVRLAGEYKSGDYHAILKTYAPGKPLDSLDHQALLRDLKFIAQLDALYLQLHLAGIAKVHLQPRKLVVRPNGSLTLVDLHTCVVQPVVGTQTFAQEMRADSRYITRLEKAARKDAA